MISTQSFVTNLGANCIRHTARLRSPLLSGQKHNLPPPRAATMLCNEVCSLAARLGLRTHLWFEVGLRHRRRNMGRLDWDLCSLL